LSFNTKSRRLYALTETAHSWLCLLVGKTSLVRETNG
jgi:hypothetical protein